MSHSIGICLLSGLSIFWVTGDESQKTEPKYFGKTVSQHIEVLNKAKNKDERLRAVRTLVLHIGPKKMGSAANKAIGAYVNALDDDYFAVRRGAAMGLEQFGPAAKAAVPALRKVLFDEDELVRKQAALALGEIGPAAVPAIPDLVRALQDKAQRESQQTRWAILEALGKFGSEAKVATPELIKSLSHEDDGDRNLAALALRRIGPSAKAAIPTLQRLAKTDPVDDVRRSASSALKQIEAQ